MQKKTLLIVLGAVGGAVVVCGGCCGVGAFLAVPRIRDAAAKTQSANDLKQVVLAMQQYLDAQKRWPAQVADIQKFLPMNDSRIRDRLQKHEIEVIWGAVGHAHPGLVIAWDTQKFGDGRNVAFMDGSVQFVTDAEFQTMPKAQTKK